MPRTSLKAFFAPVLRLRCLFKHAFGIYAAVLAAFIALGVFVLYDSHSRETQDALSTADNLARVFAERLEGTLRRIDGDLDLFVRFLPADALDDAALPRYRKQFEEQFALTLKKFPEIASRNVVNAQGISVYRAGVPTTIRDFSDRDWFIRLRDNPQLQVVISDVITARASGKPTVVIAHAIRDRNGRLRGTANATLSLDVFNNLVSSLNIGEKGIFTVRRTGENKLVLRYPPAPAKINTPASSATLTRVQNGEKSARFMATSTIDGIQRATAYRVLDDYPFYVTVGLSDADYLAEWRNTAWFSALAGIALIIAMSAFVVIRVRSETRSAALAHQLRAGKAALQASEQFLRDVIESVSDGILVEDTRGRIRAINHRFELMWKIPPEAIAAGTRSAFEPHMAQQLVNPQTLPLQVELPQSSEIIRLRPIELNDGRRIETCVSVLLHDGRKEGRVWSFHDITESKRTFRLYRSIIESSADAFVAFDHELRITAWSARAEQIFGIREDRILGRALTETIMPSAAAECGPVHQALQALQNGDPLDARPVHRVTARRENGREFPAEIQISGFRMGEHWQYTSFVRDISVRLRDEEQVAQAQKFEAIGQLTGGLAHDFNNLLGIIIGSLDLIGEDFTGDRELLEAATSAARRGAEVTRSLLSVARQQKLSPRDIGIDTLLTELAPLLKHTAGKSIDVAINAQSGNSIVNIDAGSFNNALINLVINARDAMPGGGRLNISAQLADAGTVIIRVEDSGCGMTHEVAARAFDPFFTTKVRGKGTGLGLAMVYGFARQSGGQVSLNSKPGAGTTVELRLPLRQAAATSAVVHVLPAAAPAGSGERILLVDDEPDLLRVTRQWLASLGYTVTALSNAQEAARLLGEQAFDALVSDVVMPCEINGIMLADMAVKHRPDIAIVLISGFADDLAGQRLEQYRLLDKPFGKQQLQTVLRAALEQARSAAKTAPSRQAAA